MAFFNMLFAVVWHTRNLFIAAWYMRANQRTLEKVMMLLKTNMPAVYNGSYPDCLVWCVNHLLWTIGDLRNDVARFLGERDGYKRQAQELKAANAALSTKHAQSVESNAKLLEQYKELQAVVVDLNEKAANNVGWHQTLDDYGNFAMAKNYMAHHRLTPAEISSGGCWWELERAGSAEFINQHADLLPSDIFEKLLELISDNETVIKQGPRKSSNSKQLSAPFTASVRRCGTSTTTAASRSGWK